MAFFGGRFCVLEGKLQRLQSTDAVLTILLLDNVATLLADPPKLFDAFAARLRLVTAAADGVLNASVVRFVFDVLYPNEINKTGNFFPIEILQLSISCTKDPKSSFSTNQARIGGGGGLLLRPCSRLSFAVTAVTGVLFCASFASTGGFGGATVGRGGATHMMSFNVSYLYNTVDISLNGRQQWPSKSYLVECQLLNLLILVIGLNQMVLRASYHNDVLEIHCLQQLMVVTYNSTMYGLIFEAHLKGFTVFVL